MASPTVSDMYSTFISLAATVFSLAAFVSLYIMIRRTNTGKILGQSLLAMSIGYLGITINTVIDLWRVVYLVEVDNSLIIRSIMNSFASIFIAIGCVIMFFSFKNHGLLSLKYYQAKSKKE